MRDFRLFVEFVERHSRSQVQRGSSSEVVVSLESQQPVEKNLQHRGGSETDRPGVVQ